MPSPTDPNEPQPDTSTAEETRAYVLNTIGGRRQPPTNLLKRLIRGSRLTRDMVQCAIRELVTAGELAYTFEHGRTFLEPSFDRPVRVAERIVLSPPGKAFHPEPGDVVIRIMAGASFGVGRHPTTRLALRGIEAALGPFDGSRIRAGTRALDIGTGSGVLVMAAVKLGIEAGLGVDIDPCAVAEAQANIRLNGLAERIAVSERPVEEIAQAFTLIAANVRPPTLLRLAAKIASLAESSATLVLSGLRPHEDEGVLRVYQGLGFKRVWAAEEDEWAAAAFRKDT